MDKEINADKKPTEVTAKTASSETKAIHAKIDTWFAEYYHGSIISGETAIYNFCHNAKEELKKLF